MLMAILVWAVFGLVAGAIARLLVPGRQPMGLFMTMALGIAGSILGGLVGSLFSSAPFAPAGFILSVVGAVLLLGGYVYLTRQRPSTSTRIGR